MNNYSSYDAQRAAETYHQACTYSPGVTPPSMADLYQMWRVSADPDGLVRFWHRQASALNKARMTPYGTSPSQALQDFVKDRDDGFKSLFLHGDYGLSDIITASKYAVLGSPNLSEKENTTMNVNKLTASQRLTDRTQDVRNLLTDAQSAAEMAALLKDNPFDTASLASSKSGPYGGNNVSGHVTITFGKDKEDGIEEYVDKAAYTRAAVAQALFAMRIREAAHELSTTLYVIAAEAATKTADAAGGEGSEANGAAIEINTVKID